MNYELSVITPCHNADIPMLERAFKSLQAQTLGFEHIEWVVVVHNSSEESIKSIHAMTQAYPNVSVYMLRDTYKTVAAPRNHGLERATGTYIGFLDQDDWFESDCYEKALRHIRETEADIVAFQIQSVSADDGVQTVPPFTLLDQTKEVIVMERETWDSRLFMHIMGLGVWSKIYKREFLNKHLLQFDKGVHFCDDALFNIDCFDKAKRIAFLPQLVGYNYFLHSNSTVQNINKTPDEVVRYAEGFAETFERGIGNGLYMPGVIWGYLCYMSAILLASAKLTMRERKAVYTLLSPYLKAEQMDTEYAQKSYGNDGKIMRRFPNIVIGYPLITHSLVFLMKMLKVDIAGRLKKNQRY